MESASVRGVVEDRPGSVGAIDWFLMGAANASVAVPKLWLAHDLMGPTIEWQPVLDHHAVPDGDLLAQFVKLADAGPETVVAFARQWGILGLDDKHRPILRGGGAPTSAIQVPGDSPEELQARYVEWVSHPDRIRLQELVAVWIAYARQFRALLRLVADLQDGRRPSANDLEATWNLARILLDSDDRTASTAGSEETPSLPDGSETAGARPTSSNREAGAVARLAIVRLMAALPLRYDLELDPSGFGRSVLTLVKPVPPPPVKPYLAFLFPGPSLFAILALRLVAAVTSQLGLLRCSWCSNPYPRPTHRAPEVTRRHFCSDACRHEAKKETNRAIARRRYAAKRGRSDATELDREGR